MNKLSYVFGLLCMMHGLYAKLDLNRPEAQPNYQLSTLKNFIRTFDDFTGTERLGFQALTEHNERFIRTIVHDLDMDDYCIEIRGMSNLAQHMVGRLNAFVIPSLLFDKKSHAYLFISEDWFDTLSEQEKQALIRHELMHLKQNHGAKKGRFSLLSGISLYILNSIIKNALMHRNNSHPLEVKVSSMMCDACPKILFVSWFMLVSKYSRLCEQEADIEAAKTMHDVQGFIDLFKDFKEGTQDPDSKFRIKRFFDTVCKPIQKLFSSHPELDDRIAYIEHLK